MADVSIWATYPLEVVVKARILCVYICVCVFHSLLYFHLRFQNSPQTHWGEGFLVFGYFSSFTSPFLVHLFVPNSFVSLVVFYILSYLLSKRKGCLSGCLVSSTIPPFEEYGLPFWCLVSSVCFQKLFC